MNLLLIAAYFSMALAATIEQVPMWTSKEKVSFPKENNLICSPETDIPYCTSWEHNATTTPIWRGYCYIPIDVKEVIYDA
ncbi:hypothetical protein IAQ61_007157 [Plenodomus lingam]|uniref:uncharacterized protein n=1 Tax=Leptosphaeria maculans TaxID=5022 RepID=UPI003321E601|nr:hypothetical protein IAQ61_007157 [Plenodomus lingam]